MSTKKYYQVSYKDQKSDQWLKGKVYDSMVKVGEDLDITLPTCNTLLVSKKGTCSKFVAISEVSKSQYLKCLSSI